jgi:glutamyl-tRNA reductase
MNRPMFLIDISVPRNIDPAVRRVDNAFLFDIDDLKFRVEQNRGERMQEAEKAERMVVDEVGMVTQWLQSLEVTPTIVALKTRVDAIKRAELEKAMGRLAHLSPQERESVEGMAASIVNKLIHHTMVTLKTEVTSAEGAAFVEAARRFFNLTDVGMSALNGAASTPLKEEEEAEETTPRTRENNPD